MTDRGPFAGFTLAVSHRSKHNGEWQEVNDGFFRCTTWRSVAENTSRTLKKGMRIFVAGKLVQRAWQHDGGNKRHALRSRSATWARTSSSPPPW